MQPSRNNLGISLTALLLLLPPTIRQKQERLVRKTSKLFFAGAIIVNGRLSRFRL
jgi:hypothetical protein